MAERRGPNGRPWRTARAKVLTANRVCYLQLPGCTRYATTVDHVIPRIRGGTDDPSNLAPACAHCNYSKGAGPRVVQSPTSRQW